MNTLFFYTTPGCHLCEQAQAIIWPLLERYQLQLQALDIALDDELLERYGVRIPVIALALSESAVELGWPFDSAQAQVFLERQIRLGAG